MAFKRRERDDAPQFRGPVRADRYRVIADARYGDELVGKLVNKVMLGGKKSTAEKIVYGAFDLVEERTGTPGIEAFKQALDKIKPAVEVKSRRVGGSTYQVPIEVAPHRRIALGMRWLINFTRARSERNMHEKLAGEIMDALQDRGASIKKRDDTHAMAEANKAYAHFRF